MTYVQMIYRIIVSVWMSTLYIEYFISRPEKFKTFLTFLTNQTFTQSRYKLPKIDTKLYLYLVIFSEFGHSTWLFAIYKPGKSILDYHNFSAHGISALLLIVDILFDAFPLIWGDFLFILMYGFGYIAFLFVYHSMSGIWVYDILNPKLTPTYIVIIVHLLNSSAIIFSYFIIKTFMGIKLLIFGILKLYLKNYLWKESPLKITEEDETGVTHRFDI
eukprot:gene3938-7148_t